jgi:tetratricopeptide (TPR) repeat protein
MTRVSLYRAAPLAAALALAGCVTQPASSPGPSVTPDAAPDQASVQFIAERRSQARRHAAAGRLATALREWRYVVAVAPDDPEAGRQIGRLEGRIARRKADYLRQADRAWRQNRKRQARRLYLKVLALDGGNRLAFERLRDMERDVVLAGQVRKDGKAMAAYRASLGRQTAKAKPRTSATNRNRPSTVSPAKVQQTTRRNPAAPPARQAAPSGNALQGKLTAARLSQKNGDYPAALSHLQAASALPGAEQAGVGPMIKRLRKAYAQKLYADGVKQMNINLDRAVELLSETVRLDPEHLGAHRRLAQAKRMRARLQSIR